MHLLLRQQRGDVVQRLLRAVLVITILLHEAFLHYRNLLAGLIVGPRSGRDEPQHVAPLLEKVLLDGLADPRMARQPELLAGLERDHGLADYLLAERLLAGL